MKTLKTLYMIATVVCIILATYFLCQKGFAKEDTLAGFACICAAFFFIILFGKACQKIEEVEKALKWWDNLSTSEMLRLMSKHNKAMKLKNGFVTIYKLETNK